MDFLANIIKRPKSIATTGISTNQPTTMEALEAASPADECSTPRDKGGVTLVSAHLDSLLESASEELQRLEGKHCELFMESISNPLPAPEDSTDSREEIQKFLSEINFNLNQVSANEMEHLQAMSGEVCLKELGLSFYVHPWVGGVLVLGKLHKSTHWNFFVMSQCVLPIAYIVFMRFHLVLSPYCVAENIILNRVVSSH